MVRDLAEIRTINRYIFRGNHPGSRDNKESQTCTSYPEVAVLHQARYPMQLASMRNTLAYHV